MPVQGNNMENTSEQQQPKKNKFMNIFSNSKINEEEYLQKFCSGLNPNDQTRIRAMHAEKRKNPKIALILSILLGWLAIDRIYIGHYWVAGLKIIFFLILRSLSSLYFHVVGMMSFNLPFESLYNHENLPLWIFIRLLPFSWIVIDWFLIYSLTTSKNKSVIENAFYQLGMAYRKKNALSEEDKTSSSP